MKYREIYERLVEMDATEMLERVDHYAYHCMMDLNDPKLWAILTDVNPTANMTVWFGWEDLKERFKDASAVAMIDALMNFRGKRLDFSKNYIIEWDGVFETVDFISEIECGWDDVYESAVEDGILWGYLDNGEMWFGDYWNDFVKVMAEAEDLVRAEKIYTTYAADTDTTFIMREDADTIECIGWYHGEPDEESTRIYSNKLRASK